MSQQRARIGDTGSGVCSGHQTPTPFTTIFNVGANTVLTNGMPSAIVGSIGISTCGHPTTALLGSSTVMNEKMGSHRVSDTGSNFGTYTTMIGSTDVFDGG